MRNLLSLKIFSVAICLLLIMQGAVFAYDPKPLSVVNGGTGVPTLTGYAKGNGTSAFTASATVPASDVSGVISVANGGTGASTGFVAQNNLNIGLGSNGVNGGNDQQQANITIPTGAEIALIYVTGDYYNGVAGTHTGYWHGMWRDSSNAITALADVENDSGNNQGFVVAYSSGSLVIKNKSGMSQPQSGKTRIIFL